MKVVYILRHSDCILPKQFGLILVFSPQTANIPQSKEIKRSTHSFRRAAFENKSV